MKITNEEKAREIHSKLGIYADAYYGAMEMAQWKDEQEIEFLQSLMFQASTQQALNTIINNRIKLLKGE